MISSDDVKFIQTIVLNCILTATVLMQACSSREPEHQITSVSISTIGSNTLPILAVDSDNLTVSTSLIDQSAKIKRNGLSMINLENYERVVATAIGFISGKYPSSVVTDYHRVMPQTFDLWHSQRQESADIASLLGKSYNCENGGTVATGLGNFGIVYTFNNCELPTINADLHHGVVETSLLLTEFTNRYQNLQTLSPDGTLHSEITGSIDVILPGDILCGNSTRVQRAYKKLYFIHQQDNYTATDASINFRLTNPGFSEHDCPSHIAADFKLDFQTNISGDENYTVRVSTPTTFSGLRGAITQGTLLIEAIDGSSVTLDVNQDGSDMITYTISNSERTDNVVRAKSLLMGYLLTPHSL